MESPDEAGSSPVIHEVDDGGPAHRGPAIPTAAGRTLWGEPLSRLIAVALGLLVVCAAIVVPTAVGVRGISLFDEATHADYAYEVAHGHIPAAGSVIAAPIRAEIACRGPASRKVNSLPHCGEPQKPVTRRLASNQNYNWAHPPLYYAVTGVIARAIGIVFRGPHFIAHARLVGVGWLFAGMLVLYLALRRFSVSWPIAACSAALLAATPAVFYLDGTVTNDAAGALAGSLALLTLARITVSGKLGWKLPALLAALAAATKILNALPFLVVALSLILMALRDRRTDPTRARRLGAIAGGIVVAFAAVYLGWTIFQHFRGDPNWVNPITGISYRDVHGSPLDELFSTSFTGSNLLSYGYLPPELANEWMNALLRLLGPLAVGATVAVLVLHRTWSPRFVVAASAAVGVLGYPLVVEAQIYATSGDYFPGVIPRYGLSFIPFLIAAIAFAADDKRLTRSIGAFTVACLGIALFTVL